MLHLNDLQPTVSVAWAQVDAQIAPAREHLVPRHLMSRQQVSREVFEVLRENAWKRLMQGSAEVRENSTSS